jgi:hypothetical protein
VRGVHLVVGDANLGADERRLRFDLTAKWERLGGDGKVSEVLLREVAQLVVIDAAGADEDHAVRGVVRLDVAREVVVLERQDVLLRTEDRAPKRLALERDGLEAVKDDLLRLLVDLLLLKEDDVACSTASSFEFWRMSMTMLTACSMFLQLG